MSLSANTRQKWFDKKGITVPVRRHYRDYRNAVAVCHRKIRYSLLFAIVDAVKLGNHVYKCVICDQYHTSRQSSRQNRKIHRA